MKYFNPTYWFKLWVLSAPLFNDKTQGINAKSIDNKKIKDWASKNTTDISLLENQQLNFTNSNITNQPYNLLSQVTNQNINPIYQTELETSTHKHRHEKRRRKREMDGDNLVTTKYWFMGKDEFFASFTPDFWEEITFLYYDSSSLLNFSRKFKEKCVDAGFYMTSVSLDWFTNDYTNYGLRRIGGIIHYNWEKINKIWQDSDKKHRIRIEGNLSDLSSLDSPIYFKSHYSSTYIRDDKYEKKFSNSYLNNLQRDFPDYDKQKINLGLITRDGAIEKFLKRKYPNLEIDYIEIVDKKNYSHFSQNYSFKIKVKDSTRKYSCGVLKTEFKYMLETKMNEINTSLENDPKVKQWIGHINDYNKNLPTKIEHLKSYIDSEKWIAKKIEKEIIKGYIRDWSHISTLIEHEFKLNELKENIQEMSRNFNKIKKEINDLDERILNLENTGSDWSCANIATIVAGTTAVIPAVGTVSSAAATLVAAGCAIGGV